MNSAQEDLVVTWGREFCEALGYPDGVAYQDAYEVHWRAFRRRPEVAFFQAMGGAEYAALAQAARNLLESDAIGDDQMREAVKATLWHWTT